jgi:protein-tyrosine kinase
MSTIERMAELLGSAQQLNSTPSAQATPASIRRAVRASTAPRESPESSELTGKLESILQAVNENSERSRFPEVLEEVTQVRARSNAVGNGTVRPFHPASIVKTFNVDRDLLRRQNMIVPDGERTPNAESFRRIKRQILANVAKPKADVPANLLLVTSALAGEGKTFCAINLAISIALEMNRTVLLVDADVAKPSIPNALGLNAEKGLLDVLLDNKIDLAEVLYKTDIGKLTLLPAGKPNQHAAELLASDAMRLLLHQMAERYHDRIIIFDSPPLLAASEASVLANQMGQIVVVVEAGKTTEEALKAALGHIETSKVTGLLLNKGKASGKGYYSGGYG